MPAAPAKLRCSVVIATLDRADDLRLVLECLARQTRPPVEILVCAAGDPAPLSGVLAAHPAARLLPHPVKSSARQRNHAAALAVGDVVAFLDDDIEFGPELFERLLGELENDPGLAGVHPRIRNQERPRPGLASRVYYTLQAGRRHPDFGGLLFGPAINCDPVFAPGGPARTPAGWLPATCLFLRAGAFHRHRFPEFSGYSFAEDVHLTARVAREGRLCFVREPSILHHSRPSEFKSDRAALVVGKLRNLSRVSREVLGLRGFAFRWRWELQRLFLTASLLARRPRGWAAELGAVWRVWS